MAQQFVFFVIYPKKLKGRYHSSRTAKSCKELFSQSPKSVSYPKSITIGGEEFKIIKSTLKGAPPKAREDKFVVIYLQFAHCRDAVSGDLNMVYTIYADAIKQGKIYVEIGLVVRQGGKKPFSNVYLNFISAHLMKLGGYKEISVKVGSRHVDYIINLKRFTPLKKMIGVSLLGFLLGTYASSLKIDYYLQEDKSTKSLENKLVEIILKNHSKNSVNTVLVFSAFYFSTVHLTVYKSSYSLMFLSPEGGISGIASLSNQMAEEKFPKQFIKFIEKYSINKERLFLSPHSGIRHYFNNWKEIKIFFDNKSKRKSSGNDASGSWN